MKVTVFPEGGKCFPPTIGLVAPSAAGKSWIARRLIAAGVVTGIPSVTTRPPRVGECDSDYDHVFVSPEVFDRQLKTSCFAIALENLYGHNYGLRKEDVNRKSTSSATARLLLIKPVLIHAFKELFGDNGVIYGIHAQNGHSIARELMQKRGQTAEDIAARLATYKAEIAVAQEQIDPSRYFISGGHPVEILNSLQAAIESDVPKLA